MLQNISNKGDTNSNKINDSTFLSTKTKEKLKYLIGYFKWKNMVNECRISRKLVLLVAFLALFFDNMLMTAVGKNLFIF